MQPNTISIIGGAWHWELLDLQEELRANVQVRTATFT